VALADLTQDSVRRALDQFHQLGRDAFLERYGFGKARGYFVLDRGVLAIRKPSWVQRTAS
jgi:5-methylcytosine-specific restriction enzyme A